MILVCGEELIDLFVQVRPDGSLAIEPVLGGSPYNVAIGLARLGSRTGFFSGLSKDAFGVALTRALEKEGVDLAHAPRLDNPTTLVIVSVDAAGVPTYRFIGEGAADRAITLKDLPPKLPAEVKAITFGSLSMGIEPTGSSFLALANREKGERVISIDPNLRASVVGDLGKWRTRLEAFIACANQVKVSIEDIEGTYGASASVDEIAQAWLKRGPSLVVVTYGDKGSVAFHAAGHKIETAGRKVKVIDTVGAGDTFHAALLNHFERTKVLTPKGLAGLAPDNLRDALNYATAAAAVTCTRRGADMPRAADVEAELAR